MILKIKDAIGSIRPDDELIVKTERMLKSSRERPKKVIKMSRFSKVAIAACLIAVLGAVSFSGYAYYKTPVSFVYFDINPSIELGVNPFNRVVTTRAANEDGTILLDEVDLLGSSPSAAVSRLIEAANENGYISADDTTAVSVVVCGKTEKQEQKIMAECSGSVENSGYRLALYCDSADTTLKEEAEELSISAGKLKLIKMIQQLDSTATVEDYRNMPISAIVSRLAYLTSGEYPGATNELKEQIRANLESTIGQMNNYSGTSQGGQNDTDSSQNGSTDSSSGQGASGGAQSGIIGEGTGTQGSSGYQSGGQGSAQGNSKSG